MNFSMANLALVQGLENSSNMQLYIYSLNISQKYKLKEVYVK